MKIEFESEAREVIIDGVRYMPETELQAEARQLLVDVYGALWTEAFYDPYNESTKNFAEPLANKMNRINKLLAFKK